MKIVVLDGHTGNPGDLSYAPLEALGELTVYDRTAYTESPLIAERIGDAEVIVTNKTPISRATLDKCPNLKFIAVFATGYNIIDCIAAREKGIPVATVPTYGTAAVSQFAIALLLELCHHVGHHSDSVYAGRWAACEDFCYWDYPLIELSGKTLGIIGFGRIGKATGRIAKAMGMRLIVSDHHPSDEGRAIAEYVDLDTVYQASDVISLNCSLTPANVGMINKDAIAKMKPGVLLINTSRGQLLNEEDVAAALNAGRIAGAAVDVVSSEPIKANNPLLCAKNCIITPHIAWGAKESRQRIMDTTAGNIRAFLEGKPVNIVN